MTLRRNGKKVNQGGGKRRFCGRGTRTCREGRLADGDKETPSEMGDEKWKTAKRGRKTLSFSS